MKEYALSVSEEQHEDLARRLGAIRWPERVEGAGSERGILQEVLEGLVAKWRGDKWAGDFDTRAVIARINEAPNFVTEIDGAPIHFQHYRSPHADATPLLITHGWPGAVTEFQRIIPMLTHPEEHGGSPTDAFHVVVPSLPGFTFSSPMRSTGWDVLRVAQAWAALMDSLGYSSYIAQGGDAGSPISQALGLVDAEHVAGVHLNMLMTFPGKDFDPSGLDGLDLERLAAAQRFGADGSGYMQLMMTRPLTLGFGLSDSPVGLLAWIAEKWFSWADPASWSSGSITAEDLLTVATVYWFTNTASTSANFYYEGAPALRALMGGEAPPAGSTPMAVAVFPHDPFLPVSTLAREQHPNIVRWTEFDSGGHFAALEVPELLCEDIRAFRTALRNGLRDGLPGATAAAA